MIDVEKAGVDLVGERPQAFDDLAELAGTPEVETVRDRVLALGRAEGGQLRHDLEAHAEGAITLGDRAILAQHDERPEAIAVDRLDDMKERARRAAPASLEVEEQDAAAGALTRRRGHRLDSPAIGSSRQRRRPRDR